MIILRYGTKATPIGIHHTQMVDKMHSLGKSVPVVIGNGCKPVAVVLTMLQYVLIMQEMGL